MENLEQKNIIISEVVRNQYGYKIKDEKGLTYNISEKKKDGTQTQAYRDLYVLPNQGLGLNKCVKFATVQNSQGGQSRYVRIICEPSVDGEEKYVSPRMQESKPVYIEKQETDWDKISWGKCKHAYLVESFKMIFNKNDLLSKDFNIDYYEMLKIEKTCEQWADMSMNKLPKTPADYMSEHYTPDYPEDIKIDEVPF